jgi:hypothetical protein
MVTPATQATGRVEVRDWAYDANPAAGRHLASRLVVTLGWGSPSIGVS